MQAKASKAPLPSAAIQQGFTLIEIMTVLALLAILMGIALPSYQDSFRRAKRAEAWAAMMNVMHHQERHYSLYGSYAAFSATDAKGFIWYSGSHSAVSAYEISATACEKRTLKQCVVLSANLGTEKVQAGYQDSACGTLSLTSAGVRTTSGNGTGCW